MAVQAAEVQTRKKVQLTLPARMAWKLRVVASMRGTDQGRLIEEWIAAPLAKHDIPDMDEIRGKGAAR